MEKKNEIKPNSNVTVDGYSIPTHKSDIEDICIAQVEVGTNGYQGGDAGHGCRTYLRLCDIADAYIRVRTNPNEGFKTVNNVEILMGGDSELKVFYKALKHAVEYLGQYTDGVQEFSQKDAQQISFNLYINALCDLYKKTGKLRGMEEVRRKYRVTGLTKQQFFECGLHNVARSVLYIPKEYTNELYNAVCKKLPLPAYPPNLLS